MRMPPSVFALKQVRPLPGQIQIRPAEMPIGSRAAHFRWALSGKRAPAVMGVAAISVY